MYFLNSLYSLLLYIFEVINTNLLANILSFIFSQYSSFHFLFYFFVFILIE